MKVENDKLSKFVGFSIADNTQKRIDLVFACPDFLFNSVADCERSIFMRGLLAYENDISISSKNLKGGK